MVIEDDADLREAITEILEEDLFRVVPASNGAEALAILDASPQLPGMILLDLMMPVMSGIQFRAAQRSNPRLASIPVVVMSAVTGGDAKASALEPDAFLPKPSRARAHAGDRAQVLQARPRRQRAARARVTRGPVRSRAEGG